MKFKLDENFGTRTQQLFTEAEHDVRTVLAEALQGATDERLFQICAEEERCLVTLDLDFADVTRFPPASGGGIVVIRVPRNPSLELLQLLVRSFLSALAGTDLAGNLWVVEVGRIRVHQIESDEEI